MLKYLLKKLAFTVLSLFLVATVTFILMKSIPGDPFQQEQALPKEIYEALRTHYGLNNPLLIQYGKYLTGLITFNPGPSLVYAGRTVSQIISQSFPVSAVLGAATLLFAMPTGILLGIAAAEGKGRLRDKLILLFAIIGISVPSFIISTLLQYIFGIKLGLLPIARWGDFSQVILPMLSLAAMPTAFIAKLTRAKMISEWHQPYALTALSKGLSRNRIIFFHLLRNAIPPVLAYIGPLTASIMTGSFIVEKIFSIPGLGYWFVMSVSNRDYPLIMGITVFYCSLLMLMSFLVDSLCLYLNPRLRSSVIYTENSV